eukprot:COSAG04_NODE_18803_length_432_cov_0.780781_1_plen_90_part_01
MVAQLTYWSGQGNAEVIRLMMAACGEEWEDRVALTDPPETHMRWVAGSRVGAGRQQGGPGLPLRGRRRGARGRCWASFCCYKPCPSDPLS